MAPQSLRRQLPGKPGSPGLLAQRVRGLTLGAPRRSGWGIVCGRRGNQIPNSEFRIPNSSPPHAAIFWMKQWLLSGYWYSA